MNLDNLFSEGLRHHIEGRVGAAERAYREILKLNPRHADALHHLGLVHLQLGLLSKAISEIQLSLAFDERNPSAMANLGYCFNLIGNYARASEMCIASLELDAENDGAWTNLGNAQRGLLLYTEARHSYEKALALSPNNPRYIYNIGLTFFDQEKFGQAKECFRKCLAGDPGIAEAHNNLAACSLKLQDPLNALYPADRAIELKPDYAEAWCNRGNALNDLKRHGEALSSYDRAIELKPDCAEAWSNRGVALNYLKRHEEALASYDRAIELKPDYAEAWYDRGNALIDLKRHEETLASYGRAIEIEPNYTEAHWNKSLALLRCGLFEEGWKLYEWRWQWDRFSSPRRDFIQPLWLGERPIAGKTILLHAEQGLGDTIQFYRYVKLVTSLGAKVILEVDKTLISIFKTLDETITVVAKGDVLPIFDCHCPLLSLPLAFKTDLNSIPADISYLHPDNSKVEEWTNKIGRKEQIRIGIVWGGNRDHTNDKNRSICASLISRILSDNFEWFSLQKEYRDGDLQVLRRSRIHDYSNVLLDFSDTAALLSQLDLVISVDTSVAHLAGAMGKPTWVMLPYIPDFRWLWDREDSPWYPSMRLFRQATAGDWSLVIDNVSSALVDFPSLATR